MMVNTERLLVKYLGKARDYGSKGISARGLSVVLSNRGPQLSVDTLEPALKRLLQKGTVRIVSFPEGGQGYCLNN